jgi:hypothetical protein
MICTKFHWNWPVGSGEEDLEIFSVFLLFCYYLPLEKGNPLHLNNLESPFTKNDLCQVWLKLAQWFWRRSRKCKSLPTDGQRAIRIAHLSFQLKWAKIVVQNVYKLFPFTSACIINHASCMFPKFANTGLGNVLAHSQKDYLAGRSSYTYNTFQ